MSQPPAARPSPARRVPPWTIAVALVAAATAWFAIGRRAGHPAGIDGTGAAAAAFRPTIERAAPAPASAPDGMVWIPGGEFSMGAADPSDPQDVVGMQATRDSRP